MNWINIKAAKPGEPLPFEEVAGRVPLDLSIERAKDRMKEMIAERDKKGLPNDDFNVTDIIDEIATTFVPMIVSKENASYSSRLEGVPGDTLEQKIENLVVRELRSELSKILPAGPKTIKKVTRL